MKKLITKKRLFYITICLIFIFCSIFLYKKKASAPITADTIDTSESSDINSSDVGSDTNLQVQQKEKEKNVSDIELAEMPILMYHHIRNYNNDSDPIGVNLSVSPKKFEEQLKYLKENNYTTVVFGDLFQTLPKKSVILTFDDGYDNFYKNAYPLLKANNQKAVLYVIHDFIGKNGYVNKDQIIEMSQNGIEIGSHTLSHSSLTAISDSDLEQEVKESKSKLEKIINTDIISFCYPAGEYDNKVESLVQKSGYLFAVTTKNTISYFKNPFEISRYRMNSDTYISGYIK